MICKVNVGQTDHGFCLFLRNVLSVAQVRAQLTPDVWEDAKLTASGMAQTVKNNHQIDAGKIPGLTEMLGEALLRLPLFQQLAMPRAVSRLLLKPLCRGYGIRHPYRCRLHVLPATRGERLVVVGWVQSRIRDPRKREIILDLDQVRQAYLAKQGHDRMADLLLKASSNLRRMWDE